MQLHFVEDRVETLEKVCADPRLQVRDIRAGAGRLVHVVVGKGGADDGCAWVCMYVCMHAPFFINSVNQHTHNHHQTPHPFLIPLSKPPKTKPQITTNTERPALLRRLGLQHPAAKGAGAREPAHPRLGPNGLCLHVPHGRPAQVRTGYLLIYNIYAWVCLYVISGYLP